MPKLPLWLAGISSVAAGISLAIAFPSLGWWPGAFLGVFLSIWSIWGKKWYQALVLGLITGSVFWLSLINWLTLYLGPVPWLALGILQAVFFAGGLVLISLVINSDKFRNITPWVRTLGLSIIAAALWSAREVVTSVWPYGGFSWGRLAQSQSESPFAHLVAYIGVAGLSFLVAWVVIYLFLTIRTAPKWLWLVPIGLSGVLVLIPSFSVSISGETNVLAVQGNSKAGLFDHGAPGAILQDHVSGTLPYEGQSIDMIVWPENASDISPLASANVANILSTLSERLDAPIVTGAITVDGDDRYFNSSLVWTEQGLAGQYDKIHPVPFAEYMPNREFWRSLQPDLVDLVTRDYSFGERSNVVDINGVLAGLSICFDITDDAQAQQMIAGGAELILAQTNNADFGKTSENLQQLAIARLRAIETGRSVVNISTVGTSAVMDPSGASISSIPAYEPGAMLTAVPLSSVLTPAMVFGPFLNILFIVLSLAGVLLFGVLRRP